MPEYGKKTSDSAAALPRTEFSRESGSDRKNLRNGGKAYCPEPGRMLKYIHTEQKTGYGYAGDIRRPERKKYGSRRHPGHGHAGKPDALTASFLTGNALCAVFPAPRGGKYGKEETERARCSHTGRRIRFFFGGKKRARIHKADARSQNQRQKALLPERLRVSVVYGRRKVFERKNILLVPYVQIPGTESPR